MKTISLALVAPALLITTQSWAAPAKPGAKPVATAPVTLPGKRFTVLVEGQGPDVVLIPGLATPRDVWEATRAQLKGKFRLHLVQLRGFGDAAGLNANGPVIEPFIRELADYIDDEIVNKRRVPPAIIGHSLGGLAAMMIGARYPQLAGKIMVVDALPFYSVLFNPSATAESVKPQADAMAKMVRTAPRKPAPSGDPGEASMAGRMSNTASGRTLIASWSAKADPNVVAQAMYDDMTIDLRPELAKITAPVTLLYAQDDRAFPAPQVKALYEGQFEGLKGLKAVMIKNSYHFIMFDQPKRFAEELGVFLDMKR